MTSDDVLQLSPEREEWMIRAAKLSGHNLLRLNGGTSIIETEQFYNLCDEHGLIVCRRSRSIGRTRLGRRRWLCGGNS